MKISTHFECPPIPYRNVDWSAVDSDTYDGEGCLIGRGATEQEAIDDLRTQIAERWNDEDQLQQMRDAAADEKRRELAARFREHDAEECPY